MLKKNMSRKFNVQKKILYSLLFFYSRFFLLNLRLQNNHRNAETFLKHYTTSGLKKKKTNEFPPNSFLSFPIIVNTVHLHKPKGANADKK